MPAHGLCRAPPLIVALATLAAAAAPAAAASAPAAPAPGGGAGGDELALLQVRQDIHGALQRGAHNLTEDGTKTDTPAELRSAVNNAMQWTTTTTTQVTCDGDSCSVYAVPHVSTFDAMGRGVPGYLALTQTGACSHRPVDVNAYETGDFWIVKSKDVQIQGRFVHSQEFVPDRAALGALVVAGPALRGGRLLLEPMNGSVAWAGQLLCEPANIGANRTGGVLDLTSGPGPQPGSRRVEVELPRGLRLEVVRFNKHLDAKFTMPKAFGARDGLCGNGNGVEDDDAEESVRARLGSLSVAPSELLFEGSEHRTRVAWSRARMMRLRAIHACVLLLAALQ